jgi:hypothetical protein
MTLDWFIHPDYEECSSLTDYQRLVLQNYVSYVLTSDASEVLQFIIVVKSIQLSGCYNYIKVSMI